ncbi:MAG: hypothetical protein N3D16_01345 [Anaerolineales bacterium]|nr:hypothetical protein [Anaerolineales bacterium]
MTWIRFDGERDFIDIFLACERQKLFQLGDVYLILMQLHTFPCNHCQSFLSNLLDALAKNSDIKVKLLIAENPFDQPKALQSGDLLYLPEGMLSNERLQASLGVFSSDTKVFLFDPYGSLWFAWSGDEVEAETVEETLQWLTYLDIQCPE